MLDDALVEKFKGRLSELLSREDFDEHLEMLDEMTESFEVENGIEHAGERSALSFMALTFLTARYDAIWSLLVNKMASEMTDSRDEFVDYCTRLRGTMGSEIIDRVAESQNEIVH